MKFRKGFTLAEVLITLGIIGVVAAISIPSLIANHQEKETIVKLKKVYSILSQSFTSAQNDYGSPDNWGITNIYVDKDGVLRAPLSGGIAIANTMGKYMNIIKRCDGTDECSYIESYKTLGGQKVKRTTQDGVDVILNDGTFLTFTAWDGACASSGAVNNDACGSVTVDINGSKLPNQLGRDVFVFYLTKYAIIPWGTKFDLRENSFANKCKYKGNSFENGSSCTAWVLINENMDYLRCDGLNWDTKVKCK